MKELTIREIQEISGGRPKISNLFGAAFWGGLFGGLVGLITAGPAGAIMGAQQGAVAASLAVTAREGAEGLVEIMHPKLHQN